jgi:hypothetical protein
MGPPGREERNNTLEHGGAIEDTEKRGAEKRARFIYRAPSCEKD